jgi:hypothetical protein
MTTSDSVDCCVPCAASTIRAGGCLQVADDVGRVSVDELLDIQQVNGHAQSSMFGFVFSQSCEDAPMVSLGAGNRAFVANCTPRATTNRAITEGIYECFEGWIAGAPRDNSVE